MRLHALRCARELPRSLDQEEEEVGQDDDDDDWSTR